MKTLAVRTPPFAEQQRIADCLFCLDARLAAEAEKFDTLKARKKGLMQQLFPSPEGSADAAVSPVQIFMACESFGRC